MIKLIDLINEVKPVRHQKLRAYKRADGQLHMEKIPWYGILSHKDKDEIAFVNLHHNTEQFTEVFDELGIPYEVIGNVVVTINMNNFHLINKDFEEE